MRQKLTLDLNALEVDSFDTRPSVDDPLLQLPGGSEVVYTVLGDTEWFSCGGTCGTCGGTDCIA